MTGLELVVVVAAGGLMAVAVKHTNRKPGGRASKGRGIPKSSRLVKIYNNTGATPVQSGDAGGAAAELTGRAIGATARRTSRRWRAVRTSASRRRDQLADRTAPRWERRRTTRPEPVIDRLRTLQAARKEHGWAGLRPSMTHRPPEPPAPTPAPATAPAPPQQPAAAPQPPARHLRAVPTPAPKGTTMTAAATDTSPITDTVAPPPDWAVMIDRVANFTPEDDAALVAFMHGETAGVLGYASGLEQARENCVNDVGLDPSAVSGITVYSEHMSEAAERLAEAHKQFMTVYGEILQLAAEGVQMPFNGRFFTGATG